MKFLCVDCDTAMKIKDTRGPEAGSMTVVFGCPSCGRDIAMLTNAMETQMVRSLDVKIGGRSVPAEPMETLRGALTNQHGQEAPAQSDAMKNQAAPAEAESSASKCPFTGTVSSAFEKQDSGMAWTAEAKERLERIPPFVRPMVQKSIEQHAKEKGITEITEAVMEEMRGIVGM